LLASLVLLPAVQISLRLRGFKRTAAALAAWSERRPVLAKPSDARPAAEAVGLVAGRSVVGARCLGRSLVLWFLLRRRGIDAELVIGADVPRARNLSAHAWVEVDGEPVNDALNVRERYGGFDLQLPRLAATARR
jgi:transglutaminase-like putative cysteine protease